MPCVTMTNAELKAWNQSNSQGNGWSQGGSKGCQPCGGNAWDGWQAKGSKGQGKGWGPGAPGGGKGKAAGKGAELRMPAWMCVHGENCRMAQQGTKNLGWRTHCLGCGRNKVKALEPAVARQHTEQAEDGQYRTGLNAKDRKRLKSAQKRKEKEEAAKEEAPPHPKAPPKAPKHVEATEEEIGEAPKVSIPAFGIYTMTTLKDPRAAFEFPDVSKTTYTKTAAEVVAEHKVCADTTKLSSAKEREVKYAKMVEECENAEKSDPDWLEAARKLLRGAKAEITALSKATGGTAVECMKVKLQNMTFEESKRVEKALMDKQALKAKMDAMKEQMTKQLEEVRRRSQLFDSIRIETETAWQADEVARTTRFAEVVKAWEDNIKELAASNTAKEAEMQVQEEEQDNEEEDEEAKTQEADYALMIPWAIEDLPTLEKPTPEEYTYWLHLAAHVSEWAQKGCAPCAYADLIGAGEPAVLMESLVKLIGQAYWVSMYGNRLVLATDTVPRHLGFVLWNALMKPREMAEKELGHQATKKAKSEALHKVKDIIAEAALKTESKKNKSAAKKGGIIKKR